MLSITIRNLEDIKYCTNKYAISLIFFLDIRNKKQALAKIIRKIYRIDNLKANIFIENNLIDSKKIAINIVNKFSYIDGCNIIVNLEVKTTFTIIYKQVYIKKIVNISSRFEITISIYYISISSN